MLAVRFRYVQLPPREADDFKISYFASGWKDLV